jgi:LysR family transcriptional regulator, low CO2-responsive transcriptional regulator
MERVYYKGMQLDAIRGFCRLARLGSFAAVADELGLSVPTVWRQVRALERECGVRLFARNGRGVRLTAEGDEALGLFEPHLLGIDSARELLGERLSALPRQLTVAAPAMLLNDYLAEPLRRFVSSDPEVMLSLVNEPSDLSRAAVTAGEADVGVVTCLAEEPRDTQLIYEDLLELPWLLATAEDHPVSGKRGLKLADLVAWPWILPAAETQPRRRLDEVLRREGLVDKIRVVMESRTFALTETYVRHGLGLTFFYGRDPDHPPPGIWLRAVPQWFGSMTVSLVTRKGRHLAPQAVQFMDLLRECLHEGAKPLATAKERAQKLAAPHTNGRAKARGKTKTRG